ncbi:FabD/lysophospholipase-like protein [Colletotrichum caudatum]|nr:FabD/lysophospholipase-like protein [Colletotrichum caudatum]
MTKVQLVAESHDQGEADVPDAGNWTWLEIAILDDAHATHPKSVDGVSMVWTSHYNNFLTKEYKWDGNVIAVRLCARFPGWAIFARNGNLLINIPKPPQYGDVVAETRRIHDMFTRVNLQAGHSFIPKLPETAFRADSLEVGSGDRPLRVLSLDGGGVRGLAALHILEAVMNKRHGGQKPCEVFDMIGGTSTGGFIAIMLGRLRMDIRQCIQKYEDFIHKIFDTGTLSKIWNFGLNRDQYNPKTLEDVIKKVVKEQLGDENAPLFEGDSPSCKVFVLASRQDAANNRAPVFLRSYLHPTAMSDLTSIPIWQAARATSAAPAFFPPIRVGEYNFIDGGMQANNPLGWLWTEVLGTFGAARQTNCFLSIGTGMPSNQALPKFGLIGSPLTPNSSEKALASIATNTEITNILFQAVIDAYAPQPGTRKYWRLNVATKEDGKDDFQDPGALDDTKALKEFLVLTKKYIEDHEVLIQGCADALAVNK